MQFRVGITLSTLQLLLICGFGLVGYLINEFYCNWDSFYSILCKDEKRRYQVICIKNYLAITFIVKNQFYDNDF